MKQSIYKITNSEYHGNFCELPTLSTGVIKDLLDSPARCWFNHPRLNPDYVKPEHERKFDLGSAVHDYVLEDGQNIDLIIGFSDWRKDAAKAKAETSYNHNRIPLLEKQHEQVVSIGDSVIRAIYDCSELRITDLQTDGDAELSYCWEESGVWFKTRPDFISKDKRLILDIKTTAQSANPNEFSRKAVDLGYDIQSALYRRGARALHGDDCGYNGPEFVFIVCEIEPPYLCSIPSLSAEFQALGDDKVEMAIALWWHCLKTGKWLGYPTDRIAWVETQPYHISQWEEKKYSFQRILER